MSIRIQNDALTGAGPSELNRAEEASRLDAGVGKSRPVRGAGAEDTVEISSLSGGIAESMASANVQQSSRVRELAALYASGRYEPDAAKVSSALVSQSIRTGSIESSDT